jgi:tRNA A-37 threonylcarbamoyl transferase component Bud32
MWAYSEELLQQQIPVPEPLLYIEEQRALFVTRTFMVFKWMALGPNLVFQMINPGSRASDMFTILKTAVGTVARFHNAGFIHGDLKWGNLFSDKKKTQRVILTDLEGVQRTKSSLRQGIDLARFILDGVRFRLDQQELNRLIACYLQGREAVGPFLKMGLRWRVLQKRTRYIKQGAPD